jgi:hypothetical protein
MKIKFKNIITIEQFLHLNPNIILVDFYGSLYFKDQTEGTLCIKKSWQNTDVLNSEHKEMLNKKLYKFKIVDRDDQEEDVVTLTDKILKTLKLWNKHKKFTFIGINTYKITKGS